MMMRFWRENAYAAAVLFILRLYLGWVWFDGGMNKISGGFDASGFLKGAAANPVTDREGAIVYPTYTAFLEHVALPSVKLINILVPWGELLIGLGLMLGTLTSAAALFGMMLNFLYLFAGSVGTNPWLLLLGALILAAGHNAGAFGLDRFLFKRVRNAGDNAGRRKPAIDTGADERASA